MSKGKIIDLRPADPGRASVIKLGIATGFFGFSAPAQGTQIDAITLVKEAEAYLADPLRAGLDRLTAMADDTFFGKGEGLAVMHAAAAIQDAITYGWNIATRSFHVYSGGRWIEGEDLMERAVVLLLGDRYQAKLRPTMLTVLRHLPGVQQVTAGPVEADTLINVRNGLLEWRTGRLLPHVPERCGVTQLHVDWQPGATCPNVEAFLSEVLPADCLEQTEECPEGFIWEVIGYMLFSGNPLHKAFMLRGLGRNGKGRLLHLLRTIAGRENNSTVALHEFIGNRFRVATLHGKLLNVAGDISASYIEDTALFKAITGGDELQGERKFGHPFDFRPWATPVYSANKPFGTSDDSVGFWDRWVMIHFPNDYSNSGKLDSEIDEAITTPGELSGVLNRAVPALRTLMDRGRFAVPSSCIEVKQEFRRHGDRVLAWMNDRCKVSPELPMTSRTILYDSYKTYVIDEGGKPMSKQKLFERLEKVPGVHAHKSMGVRGFTGIARILENE
jgi:putative DNA primase/helicase